MIALFSFVVFCIVAYKWRRNIFPSFLFFIYSLSFFATFVLGFYQEVNLKPSAIVCLLLFLPLFFVCFKFQFQSTQSVELHGNIKLLSNIFIIFSIPSLLFYGYYAVLTILTVDLSVVRVNGEFLFPHNFANTVFSTFATLYFVPLTLYFYYIKDGIKGSSLLLLSSFSFPLLTLCYAGRDGMLYWGMNFIALYLLFKNTISDKKKLRKDISCIVVVGIFFALIFLGISVARFSESSEGVFYSIVSYLGQQSINFSDRFGVDFFNGRYTLFPGLMQILGQNRGDTWDIYREYVLHGFENQYNVFAYFAATIIYGYGYVIAFLIAILFFMIVRYCVKSYQRRGNVLDLLIIVMLFQIPMNGVFYYRQGIGNGDVIYLLFYIVLLILKRVRI